MSKFIAMFLTVCIILSLISVLTGSGQEFSLKEYVKGLSSPPQMPKLPSAPDFNGGFFDKVEDGVKFVGLCLWYPFQFIGYVVNVTIFFFRGLNI